MWSFRLHPAIRRGHRSEIAEFPPIATIRQAAGRGPENNKARKEENILPVIRTLRRDDRLSEHVSESGGLTGLQWCRESGYMLTCLVVRTN